MRISSWENKVGHHLSSDLILIDRAEKCFIQEAVAEFTDSVPCGAPEAMMLAEWLGRPDEGMES